MHSPIVRGLAAGLIAGLLAGLFAYVVAEPSVDAAIAIEEAAAEATATGETASAVAEEPGIARSTQKLGLVLGTGLFGAAVGALFGAAALWASGRLRGDEWARACKLGAAFVVAVVVMPALVAPPNPPAVGDPATVTGRSSLYLLTVLVGLAIMVAAWATTRWLEDRGRSTPVAATIASVGALTLMGVFVAALPAQPSVGDFPASLLWEFRLSAMGTQLVMIAGTAIAFGLLSMRTMTERGTGRTTATR